MPSVLLNSNPQPLQQYTLEHDGTQTKLLKTGVRPMEQKIIEKNALTPRTRVTNLFAIAGHFFSYR